jgi:hypothetical protein
MCSAKVMDFTMPLVTEGTIYAGFLITWYAESKPRIWIDERAVDPTARLLKRRLE